MPELPQELTRRFRILGVLGKGGMGTVYRALDPTLNREVALKVTGKTEDPVRLERFRREGEVTANLSHPGIVRVHSNGVAEGVPFLAYELVQDAQTLDQAMERRDLRGRVTMVRDAARALGHAHRHGVVHRDIKPGNLLVDPTGTVKVADFGLAATGDAERLTQSGVMLGTPFYMAPEVFAAQRDQVGPPADVWALGVILYEALAGHLPFQGQTMLELGGAITSARPAPLATAAPTVPKGLATVVHHALAKHPSDRPRDGDALADALDAFLEGRAPDPGPAIARRGLYAAALIAVLVLSLAALLSATRGPPPSRDAAPGPPPPPAASEPSDPAPSSTPPAEIEALDDRLLRWEACRRWLAEHPEDARATGLLEETLSAPLRTYRHGPDRSSVAFLPKDPSAFILAGKHGQLLIVELDSGKVRRRWDLGIGPLHRMGLRGDELFIGTRLGAFRLPLPGEDTRGLAPQLLTDRHPASNMAVASDGGIVAVGAGDGLATLWTPSDGAVELENHFAPVHALAISPTGKHLVTLSGVRLDEAEVGGGNHLRLWSLPTGELLAKRSIPSNGECALFLPGGERFLVGDLRGAVSLYDLKANQVGQLEGPPAPGEVLHGFMRGGAHDGMVRGLSLTPDGRRVVSVAGYPGPGGDRGELKVWSAPELQQLHAARFSVGGGYGLAVSPDGRQALVSTRNGRVLLWGLE